MNPPLQRMTRQRTVILDTLCHLRSHPTADELYELVRRQIPSVSLGTIYRNLDVLAKSGRVRRLESGANQARFDAELSPHHHVRCRGCGKIDDVTSTPGTRIERPEWSEHGFEITDYRIEFDGLCPACRRACAGDDIAIERATEGEDHD